MDTTVCGKCGVAVPTAEITYSLVGSYCKACHVVENADVDKLQRDFLRSVGKRQVVIGSVMMVLGIAILALGLSGGGTVILVPTGMLIGGIIEAVRGLTKLGANA